MKRATSITSLGRLASTLAVLALSGCAECRLPRLDPSGEHLFVFNPPPPAACPPGTVPAAVPAPVVAAPVPAPVAAPGPASNGLQPVPMPQFSGAAPAAVVVPVAVSPYVDAAVTIAPAIRAVPVGAEAIFVAGVRGGDNYLRTNRRLDWSLAPGSVGQFSDIEPKRFEDILVGDFDRVRIISSTQAVGSTGRVSERVGQGGSIYVARGEGWIGVRSAVEGVTHVNVVAPEVAVPAERAKTATIYWYDAQYSFPEPVVTPPGTKGLLTTTVWKMISRCPLAGWTVRYELTGGPQAIFVPSGSTAVEVQTDAAGRASVEIVQKDPSPGTSQIRVQLFRPADSCSPRFLVRDGSTAVSWTEGAAPAAGPSSPTLPGPATTTPTLPGPVTTSPPGAGPPPTITPPPSGGARSVPATSPASVSVLSVQITQQTAAVVGSNVMFIVQVSNRGTGTARGVSLSDSYDEGLLPQLPSPVPGALPANPIVETLGDMAPGESRQYSIPFHVTRAGQLCHRVEVVAADGGRDKQTSCATAVAAAEVPGPATQPSTTGGSSASTPPIMPQTMPLDIRVTSQAASATTGQLVVFTAAIRNLTQQPVPNVTITQQTDATLLVKQATEGAKASGSQWVWNVSAIPPGRTITVRVQCECRQEAAKACCRFAATLADGRAVDSPECIEITAANPLRGGNTAPVPPATAPSRLSVQVNNRNVVSAGKNQQFLVQVSNDGDAAENNIVVTVQLPPGSSLVPQETIVPDPGMTSQQQPGMVQFSPIAELLPGSANVKSFRITVTTSRPGPISLQAAAVSSRQPQPVRGSATAEVLEP
jgi:uncharacterized repeat protein (TIGR01451 family)